MRSAIVMMFTLLMCSGCALTTASINVPYQSITQASHVPGAGDITVAVATTDQRTTYRDRVSSKKNGYGMEMAAIIASNDIPTTVGGAFTQELAAHGYNIGPGDANLQISLVQFYNDFKIGFLSGDAIANVAFNVEIVSPGGTIAFTRYYQGTGDNPNIQIAGGDNAQIALVKAFQNAVASAVDDPEFLKALSAAGAKAPTS